jgi:hypothetical protein
MCWGELIVISVGFEGRFVLGVYSGECENYLLGMDRQKEAINFWEKLIASAMVEFIFYFW